MKLFKFFKKKNNQIEYYNKLLSIGNDNKYSFEKIF